MVPVEGRAVVGGAVVGGAEGWRSTPALPLRGFVCLDLVFDVLAYSCIPHVLFLRLRLR